MTPASVRREGSVLHAHRTLLRAGLSLVSAFAWVFVFQFASGPSGNIADGFLVALLVYALAQATTMLATPVSAAHLRHGVKRALTFGALVCALAFAALGATLAGYFSSPVGWGLVLFGLLLGVYRALYWIPYRLRSSGLPRETNVYFEVLLALLPAFAGMTLATVPLSALRLLYGAAALMAISVIPAWFLHDRGEPFAWGYSETFAKLFDERYQDLALRGALSGIENTALFLIWPLAVFLIVGGSYQAFGLVMSVSLLVLLLWRGISRGWQARSVPVQVAFSASAWLFRLAAGSALGIVVADSYSFASAAPGAPEFFSREHAADGGSYIDEYTALQEISTAFGRIVMCAFVGAMLFTMPFSVALALALVIAAVAAGAAAALSPRIRVEAY
jgi:hypothetical protein